MICNAYLLVCATKLIRQSILALHSLPWLIAYSLLLWRPFFPFTSHVVFIQCWSSSRSAQASSRCVGIDKMPTDARSTWNWVTLCSKVLLHCADLCRHALCIPLSVLRFMNIVYGWECVCRISVMTLCVSFRERATRLEF